MNTDAYKDRANILKALGHPSRLAMVEALANGELCVCELQELVGSDISTVSKHLSLLKNAGIVRDRRQGQWIYYSLQTPCLTQFLGCLDAMRQDPCQCPQCTPATVTPKPARGKGKCG